MMLLKNLQSLWVGRNVSKYVDQMITEIRDEIQVAVMQGKLHSE